MSVHGQSNRKNFCDFDAIKKKELERRKKLRLEQVRTQSKQLSSKIRDRVAREKHRQLRNVEETKRKELLSWKEKHVNNTMADYYYCLSNVGDAHAAAERENQLTEQLNEQQRKNRQIAVRRGVDALHKERLANSKKNERKHKISLAHRHVPTTSPNTVIPPEDDKILSIDDSDDDELTGENVDAVLGSTGPEKKIDQKDSMFRFTQVSDLIEERRRVRNLCDQILESEFGTSQPEIHSESIAKKSPKSNANSKPPSQPKLFNAAARSPQAKSLYVPKSPKQPTQRSPVKGFVPKLTASASQGLISQRNVVGNTTTRKVITPTKTVRSKNVVTALSKFVSPQRRQFVPRFNKPGILKNPSASETAKAATTAESPEKVQFYDHFSRYGKEYDAAPGMVVRESLVPAMNANEAARVQNEMDELRFQQLEELKQKSEQRSKDSLQRNQVRKDYDNLTKQLDALCNEEKNLRPAMDQFSEDRISQLARNRQQNMNRAFEDICHRPVVITCPPIGSHEHNSSSDVNVAASPPPDRQHIDLLDSSDSCTSILLGYVDNRSRKLVKDIKQCRDVADSDKRKKLVTLLTRLDDLRKMLMEEIVRNSSLNLEPFYRSVLEVETAKKEILLDPVADKENGKKGTEPWNVQSQQSLEMKLEKKMRELLRKESQKVTHADDDTFDDTSGTIGSRNDREQVKILIEVKNGAKIRKSSRPKNADSRIVVAQRERKPSVGSSTSTAYRSPPATFHTEFTKMLSNQEDTKDGKGSMKPMTDRQSVEQTPLAHYITRLLGMSQKSVDQLGVSTGSSITTPSNSVIQVEDNISVIDADHLSRVQAKIDDSLRFVKEVDDSLKQPKATRKKVTRPKQNLNEPEVQPTAQERQSKRHAISHQQSTKSPAKSVYKLAHRSGHKSASANGHNSETAAETVKIPENSKRIIADLTKQIEQVRQDKQKLLEKTLSHSSNSSSGKDFDLTEYKDFASQPTSKLPTDDRSSQVSDDQETSPHHFVNEEATKNLVSTKQIGISFSRDSGIGSSRPVTSTDFRTSPDIRLTEKSTEATKVSGTEMPIDRVDPLTEPDDVRKLMETGGRKSAKPPISLKRYSPQLDTDQLQPHDLSTINEVETSAASRLNQSTRNETSASPVPAAYTKFPTFAEYARMQDIESIDASSDTADNTPSDTILKKMLEVTCLSETDLNYRKLDRTRPTDKTANEQSTNTGGTFSEYIDVEKEMKQRRLMQHRDASSTSDSKMASSSTSSDLLAKDFDRIGLNWASAMLKKTSTAQNLESSSSSVKSPIAAPTAGGGSSPGDRINGNPLNIRDFLARELLKRSQLSSSSSMSDSSTLTDQFLKSLLTLTSDSSLHQQGTLRTSTPNRINQSSESEKFVPVKEEHLFSGESILSSVRGMSQSDDTSGARETSE